MRPAYIDTFARNFGIELKGPYSVNGQNVYKGTPSKIFWTIYKPQKEVLKQDGIVVYKERNEWVLSIWENRAFTDRIEQDSEIIDFAKNYKIAAKYKAHLLPWQHERVAEIVYAIKKFGGSLDGSDLGTGKTVQNLVAAAELGYIPFTLSPKSVLSTWEYWSKRIGVPMTGVYSYDLLRRGNTAFVSYDKTHDKFTWNESLLPQKKTIMIFDEVHKCRDGSTLNAGMLIAAKRQGYLIQNLSATPAENPLHLKALGYSIGLFNSPSQFYSWILNYGVFRNEVKNKQRTSQVLMFNGSPISLIKLHDDIYGSGRGVRTRIPDLGDLFPQNQIIAEAFDMDNSVKIQKVYDEMRKELGALRKVKSKDAVDSEGRKSPLTLILRARQEIELLKVPTFCELAQDYIEEGHSVIIGLNFTNSIKAVMDKLKKHNPAIVIGGQSQKERDFNINKFQANETKSIVVNIQAGGVGISLHDIHGGHPRLSLISPTYSSTELKQFTGRPHRAGAKSAAHQKIVFAAKTIEESVLEAVQAKINNIGLLNDADLAMPFLGV